MKCRDFLVKIDKLRITSKKCRFPHQSELKKDTEDLICKKYINCFRLLSLNEKELL